MTWKGPEKSFGNQIGHILLSETRKENKSKGLSEGQEADLQLKCKKARG